MPTVAYQKQECMQIAVEDTICKNMSKGSFTLSKFAAKNAQGLETRAKADTVLSLSRVELLHSFCCF